MSNELIDRIITLMLRLAIAVVAIIIGQKLLDAAHLAGTKQVQKEAVHRGYAAWVYEEDGMGFRWMND